MCGVSGCRTSNDRTAVRVMHVVLAISTMTEASSRSDVVSVLNCHLRLNLADFFVRLHNYQLWKTESEWMPSEPSERTTLLELSWRVGVAIVRSSCFAWPPSGMDINLQRQISL
jgi:hypothetical protein